LNLNARGCIKGVVLQSRLAFVREKGGQGAVEGVLSRVPPEVRSILTDIILPVGWYPFEISETLDRAIAREFGAGDLIYRQMGGQSAAHSLASAHRNLVRSRDPHGLLKQAAQIHRLYYDSGYRTYEWVAWTKAMVRIFDCKSFSRADCLTIIGWHEKALELCGAKPRIIETQCRTRGEKCCEYAFAWE